MSQFMMVWKVQSSMPEAFLPTQKGWKRTWGVRERLLPMALTLPSVTRMNYQQTEEASAVFISWLLLEVKGKVAELLYSFSVADDSRSVVMKE